MRPVLAIFAGLALCTAAHAQLSGMSPPAVCADGQPCASQVQLGALAATVPTPLAAVPPSPTPGGVAGSGLVYIPGNAATLTLCRRTTTVTTSSGAWSVTWATPLVSSTPWAGVDPIWASTTMPPVCWIETVSASGVAGQCLTTQTTTLNLSIVTAGLAVNPFGGGAVSLTVKVHACEPTQ